MKKFSKVLLLTMLAVILVFNTCGIVLADTNATITVTEETVNAETGVKKLVFTATTPAGSAGVNLTSVVFSWDNTIIQPVSRTTGNADVNFTATTSNATKTPFKVPFSDPDEIVEISMASVKVVVDGTRTAAKVDSSANDTVGVSAASGIDIAEFYYKVKEGKTTNSETFKIETDYTDGSILKEMCPDENTAAAIKLNTSSTYFKYATPADDTENISKPTITYSGSNIKVFKELVLSTPENATSINVPVVYPTQGAAATLTVSAKAMATDGEEKTDYVWDGATWAFDGAAPEGVTIAAAQDKKSATINVAAGAAAGTVKVKLTVGSDTVSKDITISRAAETATVAKIYEVGSDNAITAKSIVKPVSGDAKRVTFVAKLFNQYGGEIADTAVWSNDSALANVTVENNIVTVPVNAADGTFNLTATYGGVTETVAVTVCGLEVTWPAITAKENLKYGVQYKDTLDGVPAGTVTDAAEVDGTKYDGTFEVVDGTDKPTVADTKVTVKFTVTEDGDYKNVSLTKDFTIAIAKADYDMSGVSLENKDVAYGNDATVALTGTLPDGVTAEITYALVDSAVAAPSTTAPTAVGVYTVTAAFTGADTDNYNTIADKTATLTIKDEAAIYTTVAPTATMTAYEAAETNFITDLASAKTYMNLPATVDVSYGSSQTTTADVVWADATQTWNAKGGTYTFVGTVADPETYIKMGSDYKTITATLTINASTATAFAWGNASSQDAIPATVQVKQSLIAGAMGYPDINLQEVIKITLGENDSNAEIVYDSVTYDKSVEEIQALNLAIGATTTVTPVIADLPNWMTVTLPTITIEVTDKDPVTVGVTLDNTTYGTDLAEPQGSQTEAGFGTDEGATYTYSYEGRGETTYGPSADKPTAAGTYKVTATLVSETLAGSGSADFVINKKPVTYIVSNKVKTYGDANPAFEGELTDVATDLAASDYALVEAGTKTVDEILGISFDCEAVANTPVNAGPVAITATTSNANYDVTVTPGALTIDKKALSAAPVITNQTVSIGDTPAATVDGVDASEYDLVWMVNGTEAAITVADAGKALTVKAVAKTDSNYSGETAVSEAKTIADYTVTGTITLSVTQGEGDDTKVDAGDTITVVTSAINDYATLESVAGFTYVWTNITSTGETTIADATTSSYLIPEGFVGSIKASITATGHYNGTITSDVVDVNKTILAGTLTIAGETTEGSTLTVTPALNGTQDTDWTLAWYRGETAIENATETTYVIANEDLGKNITVKATAIGDAYTGTVTSAATAIPAVKPSNIVISKVEASEKITVTLTAKANGADITQFALTITDGDAFTDTVTVSANESGAFVHEFTGLTNDTTYTLTATATNAVGTSDPSEAVTAKPYQMVFSSPSSAPSPHPEVKPDDSTPEVSVKVESPKADISNKVLAGKESVTATTQTKSGTEVSTTVDLTEGNINRLTVTTNDSENKGIGAAAEGIVGAPVEIKVDAKDEKGNKVDVTVNVAIPSEEKAYAYIVDEKGVATRTESVYNEETGEVEVANVPDGAVVMISTTAPATFDDAADHWAEETINYAVDAGIMNGVGGSAFDPNGEATRGMVNAMMVRLAKVTGAELEEAADDHKVDTDAAHWAASTDLIALANGWTTGVRTLEDGTVVMDTDATVTREQLVTMLWRFVEHPEAEGDITSFDDHHETSDWAKEAKAWAVGAGIINGKPGNVLDPNGTATRAEIATMFGRLMDYMTK